MEDYFFNKIINSYPDKNYKNEHNLVKRAVLNSRILLLDNFYFENIQTTNENKICINEVLAIPFKSCLFQRGDNKTFKLVYEDDSLVVGNNVEWFVVSEESPSCYYYLYSDGTKIYHGNSNKPSAANFVVKRLIANLHTVNSRWGTEKVNIRAKIRSNGVNESYKINQVIHIVPKTSPVSSIPNHQNIDWSHRWEVRGHWRVVDTIGKNREGVYCVNGFTWVKDFVKGPEDKPIVIKTRIFHNQEASC